MLVKQKKSWQEIKDKLDPHPEVMDGVSETKALDAFLEERDKQTEFSKADREWEKDRKKEWQDNKKYWEKDQAAKAPKNPYEEAYKDVKNGGIYQTSVHPLQGYVLTKLEKPVLKTPGGLILPENTEETPNTARVIEVGEGYWIFNDHFQEPTVKPGEMVIFRKMAGQDIEVKGEKLLMLHFLDLIARVDD